MHKARAFFCVCAGAEAGGMVIGFSGGVPLSSSCQGNFFVMTDNGDVYGRNLVGGACGSSTEPLTYIGNFWSGGGPVPARRESFGSLKVRYR
jgi:hypothetical protein